MLLIIAKLFFGWMALGFSIESEKSKDSVDRMIAWAFLLFAIFL